MAQLAGVRLVTYLEYLSARRTSPVERNVTVDVQTASREMLLIIHPYIHYRTAGTLIHLQLRDNYSRFVRIYQYYAISTHLPFLS